MPDDVTIARVCRTAHAIESSAFEPSGRAQTIMVVVYLVRLCCGSGGIVPENVRGTTYTGFVAGWDWYATFFANSVLVLQYLKHCKLLVNNCCVFVLV